jgi:hypothetical protein
VAPLSTANSIVERNALNAALMPKALFNEPIEAADTQFVRQANAVTMQAVIVRQISAGR